MDLSQGEKLILTMLSEIYDRLELDSGLKTNVIREAIYGGHHWAIEWEHPGLFPNRVDDDEQVNEVVDILDMWTFIEEADEELTAVDRHRLEREADPFGRHVRFMGFDGNNETQHRGIALMFVQTMGRFPRFHGRDLNSHAPLLDSYRRMFAVFRPIRDQLEGRALNVDEIVRILTARRYPG